MAEFVFNFCPNSRVAELLAPEEPEVKDFNGWVYHPVPVLPFRPNFRVTLEGLKWYLNGAGTGLDTTTDPTINAGRLEAFYKTHRLFKPFNFTHEYLGTLELRFSAPLSIPKGLVNGGGAVEPLQINMIQHNATY
jgi:hypothetical protein